MLHSEVLRVTST